VGEEKNRKGYRKRVASCRFIWNGERKDKERESERRKKQKRVQEAGRKLQVYMERRQKGQGKRKCAKKKTENGTGSGSQAAGLHGTYAACDSPWADEIITVYYPLQFSGLAVQLLCNGKNLHIS
jgi:hypothetical protein